MSETLEQAVILAKLLQTLVQSDGVKRTRKNELADLARLTGMIREEQLRQEKKDSKDAALRHYLNTEDASAVTSSSSAPVASVDDSAVRVEMFALDSVKGRTDELLGALSKDLPNYNQLVQKIKRKRSTNVFADQESADVFTEVISRLVHIIEHIQVRFSEELSHNRLESFHATQCLGSGETTTQRPN
jgi:hypothetical protein